jgi:hypothetical protein
MSDAPRRDLEVAIIALSKATAALEWRLEALQQRHCELLGQRQRWLTDTAASLLPSLSSSALSLLENRVADFVTPPIRQHCQQHRKWLGVFAGQDYSQALAVLQTRLASHLDQARWGQLPAFDDELQHLANEQRFIDTAREDGSQLLQRLRQAHSDGVPLSPALREQVRQIVLLSKPPAGVAVDDDERDDSWDWDVDSGSSSSLTDNAADLWVYLTTDLPVSLRTLAIDTFTPQPLPLPEFDEPSTAIATDDSLGLYS